MKKYFQLLSFLIIPIAFFGIFRNALAFTGSATSYHPTTDTSISIASVSNHYSGMLWNASSSIAIESISFKSAATSTANGLTWLVQDSNGVTKATWSTSNLTIANGGTYTSRPSSTIYLSAGYYFIGVHYDSGTDPKIAAITTGTNPAPACRFDDHIKGLTFGYGSCVSASDPWYTLSTKMAFVTPTTGNVQDFPYFVIDPGASATYGNQVTGDYFIIKYSDTQTATSSEYFSPTETQWGFPNFEYHTAAGSYSAQNYNVASGTLSFAKLEKLHTGTTYTAFIARYPQSNGSLLAPVEYSDLLTFTVTSQNAAAFADADAWMGQASSTLDYLIALQAGTCDSASSTIVDVWNTGGTMQAFSCVITRSVNFGINLILLPHSWTKGLLGQQYDEFKQVFPFSIFFGLTDRFLAATQSSTIATAQTLTYNWESPILYSFGGGHTGGGGATGNYNVLVASSSDSITFSNSNTLSNTIGRDQVVMIMNAILLIAIMTMIYIIYRMFYHQ